MTLEIVTGDITKQEVDAIVNAANCSLLGGGGVDGAIHRAAGKELLEECKLLQGCETGKAKITKGYHLPASYVIHTPGPIYRNGTQGEAELLASCYRSCMELAEQYQCKSVAFPSISTGVYHYPLEEAAEIAVRSIMETLEHSRSIEQVFMICFNDTVKQAYDKALCTFQERKKDRNFKK